MHSCKYCGTTRNNKINDHFFCDYCGQKNIVSDDEKDIVLFNYHELKLTSIESLIIFAVKLRVLSAIHSTKKYILTESKKIVSNNLNEGYRFIDKYGIEIVRNIKNMDELKIINEVLNLIENEKIPIFKRELLIKTHDFERKRNFKKTIISLSIIALIVVVIIIIVTLI